MAKLAERYARVDCPDCKGKCTQVVDVSVHRNVPDGFEVLRHKETINCVHCRGSGSIINKEYLQVAEEALAARRALAQEICEGLKVRGHWAPKDFDSADVINAVFQALERARHEQ